MKLVTWNVNGIRACLKKGLIDFLISEQPDLLFLQETKATFDDVPRKEIEDLGYHLIINPAQKKGYSGVGVISKHALTTQNGIGNDYFDSEGRILITKINGISIYNIYFPSGSSGELRQKYKYEFLDFLYNHLTSIELENLIICGDVNICHTELDIHHPKQATKLELSGFLAPERAWVDKFLELGFIDSYRYFNPESRTYSWWTYRQGARGKNLGWRIDYFFVSKNLVNQLKSSSIHTNILGSDHCPVEIGINI